MDKIKLPDKKAVRKWLRQGVTQHRRPPDPEQIRRELGWGLVDGYDKDRHLR